MHGWFAATQRIVVHAGHVVMHQRIRVDHFNGAGRTDQFCMVRVKQLAGGKYQQRTYALAAVEYGISHRFVQGAGNLLCRGQKIAQCDFYLRLDLFHPFGQADGCIGLDGIQHSEVRRSGDGLVRGASWEGDCKVG